MPWVQVVPFVDPKVRGLCAKPYPNHPKGCPNFNKKPGCPMQVPLLGDVYDLTRECFAIYNVFDFAGHVTKMKAAHPEWSQRQLECCLYWQPAARKMLQEEIIGFLRSHREFGISSINRVPEAMGLNVTQTLWPHIQLEWPPVTKTVQVAFAGWRK